MNIKYSFIFTAFLSLLLTNILFANEKTLEFNAEEIKKIIEIEKNITLIGKRIRA